jgi:hypothetical protein
MDDKRKDIAILTNFRSDDSSFSLCNVVNEQLAMFHRFGYEPTVLATEGFKPSRNFKEDAIRHLPDQTRANQATVDDTFKEDTDKLVEAFEKTLSDINVVITHDTVYSPDAIKHNVALRAYAEKRKDIFFLHWIHSATSPYNLIKLRPRFPEVYKEIIQKTFPRSFYVFFNDWSVPRIANEYSVGEELVKVVHHSTDYLDFAKYDDVTKDFIADKKLLEKDFICVYPARLDTGKQLEYPIKLMGAIKKLGFSVSFIAVDFHSSSDDPRDPKFVYRNKLKDIAIDWGLNEREISFTSEYKQEWKVSTPRTVVSDLLDISNIFFMSSASESYSLVTQEASMKGNLLILNRNFPPFRDIFGSNAIFFPCNSNIDPTNYCDGDTKVAYHPSEEAVYDELAKQVVARVRTDQEITRRKLLRERTPECVFRREMEPLFFKVAEHKWE